MTNFIFARREIQRSIDRLAGVLEKAQLAPLIGLLNNQGKGRLPAMWEVVLLEAFSRLAELRHESPLQSGRKPDFELTWHSSMTKSISIVGDIVTISDSGLDEQNPVGVLFQEGARIATRLGINPNHLGYRVDGDRIGAHGDARIRLPLPAKDKLIAILNGPFKAWLTNAQGSGGTKATFDHNENGHKFSITFDPTQRYSSGSYTSYDVAASLENNPLYRALKAKRKQLHGASETAVRLIVVCDGDCAILSRNGFSTNFGSYSAKQIASHFLGKTSGVDAVLLVTVDTIRAPISNATTYKLRFDLEVANQSQAACRPERDFELLGQFLRCVAHNFPSPCQSPVNAAMRCRDLQFSRSRNGAYKMESGRISISSRGLLDLLAGAISSDQFHEAQFWSDSRIKNMFASMRSQGRLITNVRIEPMDAPDDDWLTFEFGNPDPAASPFVDPRDYT